MSSELGLLFDYFILIKFKKGFGLFVVSDEDPYAVEKREDSNLCSIYSKFFFFFFFIFFVFYFYFYLFFFNFFEAEIFIKMVIFMEIMDTKKMILFLLK
jgi:hypothetical protein